jgi:ferredoxin hydrogenase gamma subunit
MIGHINEKLVMFHAHETILSVAQRHGHFIPTLCELRDIDHAPGTCRVCLVDIKQKGDSSHHIVPSCITPMEEGMEVRTRTREVREKQRLQVELLLADHPQDCATCIRHGNCELQDVAQFVGLQKTRYNNPAFYEGRTRDASSPSIMRDMTKCIRCFRCVSICREVQGIDALVISEKGLATEVEIRDGLPLGSSSCIGCGQCVLVCPVGALAEKDSTEIVIDYLYDPDIVTVFQLAPAVRTAVGEEIQLPPGENLEGQIITALKNIGADIVLDTNFTADLVIMEEGCELLSRIQNRGVLPLFTSCCPAWINFVEKNYPELRENVSTTKSPQQCFGTIAKTYLAEQMSIDPDKMRVISIMPCTAKKGEAERPEFERDGKPDVDEVLTTRELARLLRREGSHLDMLDATPYDNPWMGAYSGAGAIFGTTGGVMEAAIRTVYYLTQGKELEDPEFTDIRGMEYCREARIDLGEGLGIIRVAVAHSIKAAQKLVEAVKSGRVFYHFVEVMACPGGCLEGGGQPRHKHAYQTSRAPRREAIFTIDRMSSVRQSHNNPLIQNLYATFLESPNSARCHSLLHTHYRSRKRRTRHTIKALWDEIRDRT